MKNKHLLKINLIIAIILVIGFVLTAVLSYRANYQTSLDKMEQISSLTAEGIYYRLTTLFAKPVNISLAMSHDNLLVSHLAREPRYTEDAAYIETTKAYLENYQKKYHFDSVFLVSATTGRYYNFRGMDRVLTKENPENVWYFRLLDSAQDYSLDVDNDEVQGAENAITVFVNCKIKDAAGRVLGVVGVGIRIDSLQELLKNYEEKYYVAASLISKSGTIEISTAHTGYEGKNWFTVYQQEDIREKILGWNADDISLKLWAPTAPHSHERSLIVTRFIPELSWNLVVAQNTGLLIRKMQTQLYQTCAILVAVILIVLFVITTVIRKFNSQITQLMEERQQFFTRATEQQYDNIWEFNITENCAEGTRTEESFATRDGRPLPYDQGIAHMAETRVKKEFRRGYLETFSPQNIIRAHEAGNNHLRYDFMTNLNGGQYYWMRVDAHIFYSAEDASIHMLAYRKNIDAEKKQELRAATDEMTGFYTKKATERAIDRLLSEKPDSAYAFFIFDIDNFKQANDRFGHAFGDLCIRTFTGIIKRHFRGMGLLGRSGGDEFVAFLAIPDREWAEATARSLSAALCTECADGAARWRMSASIGVALAPRCGTDFAHLYQNADAALYQTKKRGKNGFTMNDCHDGA